jgi:hypothetical protein
MTHPMLWGTYMALPETLSAFTRMFRSDVERADMTRGRSLRVNTQAHIENLRAYLRPTPSIDEACAAALTRCREYADEIAERGSLFSVNDLATQQARKLALNAIDELENKLQDARPSDLAIGLGLGW